MGSITTSNGQTPDGLLVKARSLIKKVVDSTDPSYGFGTLSCTIYDTAWVALVTRVANGQKIWLFPECFGFLLDNQGESGSWSDNTGVQIDAVLNTLAGLLVLIKYRSQPLQSRIDSDDLDDRIQRATAALRGNLASWDLSTTNNVGFEIIVPAMLRMLEAEDPSLDFQFEGKQALMEICDAKMSRFKPEWLYAGKLMTLTHSLEALVGKIDFDQLEKYTVMGSMFASPSSTAAYLMHATNWDDQAEHYLRHAIKASTGRGTGGVPGVFPTTTFEYTWILSTLLRAGFTAADLESPELSKIQETLLETYHNADGAVGLAPGIEPDMDDSAKIVSTLNMLGTPIPARRLCEIYETPTHFRVYPAERDASFSANCNALAALLHQPDLENYVPQIVKVSKFLCNKQWEADEKIADKWNTSHLYSSFLYAEAMVDLLDLQDQGKFNGSLETELLLKVSITLFQSSLRAILQQEADGSWGHSFEETAYAVLMLAEARRLSFFNDIRQELDSCVERGAAYLSSADAVPIQYIWSDKVTYGSSTLTEAYILSARRAIGVSIDKGTVGSSVLPPEALVSLDKRIKLLSHTPLFKSVLQWELRASMIEASLYQPLLHNPDLEVIKREGVVPGAYLTMIPLTWTSCNNRSRTCASASYLWEMMALSYFTYQIDEFMEGFAGPLYRDRMGDLHQIIDKTLADPGTQPANSTPANSTSSNGHSGQNLDPVPGTLSKSADFILGNPIIQRSSAYDQQTLRQELRTFLHAHATQVEDNLHTSKEELILNEGIRSHITPFFRWVRTTSADHIAGAFCFYYAVCLLGGTLPSRGSPDCFQTTMEKYLAASTCGHLSSMCRMYNDLGSWTRDSKEGNLNCIHFPEFGGKGVGVEAKKAALFQVAQFERGRWNAALELLEGEMQRAAADTAAKRAAGRRAKIVSMFCDVTDLYGQIYVLRDISAPIKDEMRNGGS